MLRRLLEKDVDRMLEWMHDTEVNRQFKFDYASMTRERVLEFIERSFDDKNQNFAFVNDQDDYMGTISLKNISKVNRNAEYAIVTRRDAQGTGAAKKATEEILAYAFDELQLHKVYLNVLDDNIRANRFYEKCGFVYEGKFVEHLFLHGEYKDLNWYAITRK